MLATNNGYICFDQGGVAYQDSLCVAHPPCQVANVPIGLNYFRGQFNTKSVNQVSIARILAQKDKRNSRLVHGKNDPLGKFTIPLHETAKRLVHTLRGNLRIPIETITNDRQ